MAPFLYPAPAITGIKDKIDALAVQGEPFIEARATNAIPKSLQEIDYTSEHPPGTFMSIVSMALRVGSSIQNEPSSAHTFFTKVRVPSRW